MNKRNIVGFWNFLEKGFTLQRLSPQTIANRRTVYFLYCNLVKINNIVQLEDLQKANLFIKLRKQQGVKDTTLKNNLEVMRDIIQYHIEIQGFEQTEFSFKQNVFRYLTKKIRFADDSSSHKARSIKEVEIWIKLLNQDTLKGVYVLYYLGLRRSEAIRLKKNQFTLQENYIKNVIRKGNRLQKKFGLPKFVIPFFQNYLKQLGDNDLVFPIQKEFFPKFGDKHLLRLQKLQAKLEHRENNPYWQNIFDGLSFLVINGKITPHQLRVTWDTLAEKNRMRESYRKYHMNHRLSGMDDIYVQIAGNEEIFNDYLSELNRCTPSFQI